MSKLQCVYGCIYKNTINFEPIFVVYIQHGWNRYKRNNIDTKTSLGKGYVFRITARPNKLFAKTWWLYDNISFFVLEIRYKNFCLKHFSLNLSCCNIGWSIFIYTILSSPTNSMNRRNKKHLKFEDKLWEKSSFISMTLDQFVPLIYGLYNIAHCLKRTNIYVDL